MRWVQSRLGSSMSHDIEEVALRWCRLSGSDLILILEQVAVASRCSLAILVWDGV